MNRIFAVSAFLLLALSCVAATNGIDSGSAADRAAPNVSTSFSGSGNVYSITATATDENGISSIVIFIAKGERPKNGSFLVAKACYSADACTYTGGNDDGAYTFYATVRDASFNRNMANSPWLTFHLPLEITKQSDLDVGSTLTSGGESGGAYLTSAKLSNTCAGQVAQLKINYLVPFNFASTVNVVYSGEGGAQTVLLVNISKPTAIEFVPERAGVYEVRVSSGGSQATTDFRVEGCEPGVNSTAATASNLEFQTSPLFSRTVRYDGGFSKEFRVYKLSDSQGASYYTEITLSYVNIGNAPDANVSIADSVPKEILSSPDRITFQNSPSEMAATPMPSFSWAVKMIPIGGRVSYTYRIERPLTYDMIGRFASPRVLAKGESIKSAGNGGSQDGGLLAASIALPGFSIGLPFLACAAAGIVLLVLLAVFIFRRNEDG